MIHGLEHARIKVADSWRFQVPHAVTRHVAAACGFRAKLQRPDLEPEGKNGRIIQISAGTGLSRAPWTRTTCNSSPPSTLAVDGNNNSSKDNSKPVHLHSETIASPHLRTISLLSSGDSSLSQRKLTEAPATALTIHNHNNNNNNNNTPAAAASYISSSSASADLHFPPTTSTTSSPRGVVEHWIHEGWSSSDSPSPSPVLIANKDTAMMAAQPVPDPKRGKLQSCPQRSILPNAGPRYVWTETMELLGSIEPSTSKPSRVDSVIPSSVVKQVSADPPTSDTSTTSGQQPSTTQPTTTQSKSSQPATTEPKAAQAKSHAANDHPAKGHSVDDHATKNHTAKHHTTKNRTAESRAAETYWCLCSEPHS